MSESPSHLTACLLPPTDRTVISHTKALDPTRPVTFVTNEKYNADLGVSLGVGWPPHCLCSPVLGLQSCACYHEPAVARFSHFHKWLK